jgi:MYXO-CTERM domain-containing protein
MDNLTVGQAIPTPGAVALLGVAGLAGVRRRR